MEYIDDLWEGVKERLGHFDREGPTAWSEAPAEGVFSILSYICEHKPSLKLSNITKLCRIVKEGPPPGSQRAEEVTNKLI